MGVPDLQRHLPKTYAGGDLEGEDWVGEGVLALARKDEKFEDLVLLTADFTVSS